MKRKSLQLATCQSSLDLTTKRSCHGDVSRGWRRNAFAPLRMEEVLAVLTNLYLYAMVDMEFSKSQQKLCLPPLPVVAPTHVIRAPPSQIRKYRIVSTLSSYLTGYHDSAAQEPTEEEIDATLGAMDCLRMCKIEDFLRKMLELPEISKLEILDVIESELKTLIGEKEHEERDDLYEAALFLLEIGTLFSIETASENITRRMVDLFRECFKTWVKLMSFSCRVLWFTML